MSDSPLEQPPLAVAVRVVDVGYSCTACGEHMAMPGTYNGPTAVAWWNGHRDPHLAEYTVVATGSRGEDGETRTVVHLPPPDPVNGL